MEKVRVDLSRGLLSSFFKAKGSSKQWMVNVVAATGQPAFLALLACLGGLLLCWPKDKKCVMEVNLTTFYTVVLMSVQHFDNTIFTTTH